MKFSLIFLSGLLAMSGSMNACALMPGERVDNFRLLDQQGVAHELRYLSNMNAIGIMAHGNGCPIVRQSLPALRKVRDDFRDKNIEFLLLNSNLQDDRAAVAREAAECAIDFPVLLDETQLIGESLDLTRTAEVLVIDPKTWKLVYRGPVDDRLALGAQKPAAAEHYLATVLEAMVHGKPVDRNKVEAVGCLIDFPERARKAEHAHISYSEQIAPLLEQKCTACHRPGGIGPWAMTGYKQVSGFAPMIREVIRTKRMPPWHADPPPTALTVRSWLAHRCSSSVRK